MERHLPGVHYLVQKLKAFKNRPHTQSPEVREGNLAVAQKAREDARVNIIKGKLNIEPELTSTGIKGIVDAMSTGHPSTHGIQRATLKQIVKPADHTSQV